jgi:hypothetical protein
MQLKHPHLVFLTAVLATISGCATQPAGPTKGYIGPERPLNEVAIIKASTEAADFRASLLNYGEGESKFSATKISSNNHELRLLPGEYTIQVYCSGTRTYAMPFVQVTARAGAVYEISCSRTVIPGNSVRAGVSAIYESQPQQ